MNIDLRSRMHRALCLLVATFPVAGLAIASPVTLDDETVTFCQDGYPINDAVDGNFGSCNGWAVYGQIGNNQTAVFKASNDVGGSTATQLAFQLHMFWGDAHTLGRFRLSAKKLSCRTWFGISFCLKGRDPETILTQVQHKVQG